MGLAVFLMLLCLVVMGCTDGLRETCDFSKTLVEDCEAVIDSTLTLQNNPTLKNVKLELTCPSHYDPCIEIASQRVEIYDTVITCSPGTKGIGITSSHLSLTSVNFTSCAGAIIGSSSSLFILNSNFQNNNKRAIEVHSSGDGSTTMEITGSSFISNIRGDEGGGQQGGGAVYAYGTDRISIIDTEFFNNSATDWNGVSGGAVYISNCQALTLQDSSFTNNTVAGYTKYIEGGGGGILIRNTQHSELKNVTFIGNSAVSTRDTHRCYGGGVKLQSTQSVISECYFADNTADNGGMLYANSGSSNVNTVMVTKSEARGNAVGDVYCYYSEFYMDAHSYSHIENVDKGSGCIVELLPY